MVDEKEKAEEKIILNVKGMTCASCVSRVEKALEKNEGVEFASVNLTSGKVLVAFNSSLIDNQKLISSVEDAGYSAEISDKTDEQLEQDRETELGLLKTRAIVAIAVAVVVMFLTMDMMVKAIAPIAAIPGNVRNWIALLLTLGSMAWAGNQFYVIAWKSIKKGVAEMNTLVALGTLSAFIYSAIVTIAPNVLGSDPSRLHVYFDSAATIIGLILLGRYFEGRAKHQAGDSVRALMDLSPKTAFRIVGDEESEVPVSELVIGDLVRVKPGGQVAADGEVVDGASSIDESLLTGESEPVDKHPGDMVRSGTINATGTITFRVETSGKETMLGQIIEATRNAQALKPAISRTVDRVAALFVPLVILVAILTAVYWTVTDTSETSALIEKFPGLEGVNIPLQTFISVLVIACPCALGLATPTAILIASGVGARNGILIKDGPSLETAGYLGAIVLDKTGTITEGKPSITNILPYGDFTEEDVIRYAASVEQFSEHPAAKAVMAEAEKRKIKPRDGEEFTAEIGRGVRAKVGGSWVRIGSEDWLTEEEIELDDELVSRADLIATEARTPLFISRGSHLVGLIGTADTIKKDAEIAITHLIALGLKPVLCSGDQEKVARSVGAAVGIKNIKAEVGPQDKAGIIRRLKREGKDGTYVAMVGDGINDAVALTEADIGMAMGTGSDVAMQAGDFILVHGDLKGAVTAIELSRATMSTINSNLFLAFVYNVVAIPVAAGVLVGSMGAAGLLNPMIAAAAMSLSSISVVVNSLKLNGFRSSL